MSKLTDEIKFFIYDFEDKVLTKRRTNREIKKYKDPKRKAIYKKIELTELQEKAIDDFYKENLGRVIPHTWHRHFTAFTGNFDYQYFPELLYIPKFEHYMNYNNSYCEALSDKNFLSIFAKAAGVRMPISYLSNTYGIYRNKNFQIVKDLKSIKRCLDEVEDYFVKPTIDSCSGEGCFLLHVENGIDTLSGQDVVTKLMNLSDNWVCQERIKCHNSITRIYPNSVNTFRVITYRWKDDFFHCPVLMRIGQGGGYVDNAHAGGMFIGVEDDGSLQKKAFTEFKKEYTEHPDTHIVFEECKIPLVPKVIKSAIDMHKLIPEVGVVNWDFTIDESGVPVLIEGNMTKGGSIWLSEMSHGKGAFGENTAEILRWIALMEKTPAHLRDRFLFGNMEGNK